MNRSRRNHSPKFKARIALEALKGDATFAVLASRHSLRATRIATWRKQLPEHAGEVFENGNPAQRHKIYPYLPRDVLIERPNQVWATDITYLPMAKGFACLVAILELYSRKVLAWRVSNAT